MKILEILHGVITGTYEDVVKQISGTGRFGEKFAIRHHMQHFGFSSNPPDGSEILFSIKDGIITVFAEDNVRYRIKTEKGETVIFNDQGDKVYLTKDREIIISGGEKVTVNTKQAAVNATEKIVASAPAIEAEAQTSVKISAPAVEITGTATIKLNATAITVEGNVSVTGNINATGNIMDSGNNTNHHSHS